MHAHNPGLPGLEKDAIESDKLADRKLQTLWVVCRPAQIDLWHLVAIRVTRIAYPG
jgi:hypothetical protein